MKEITEDKMLEMLHNLIDKKFKRESRRKYIDPILLKSKITLYALSGEFSDYEPSMISKTLKSLTDSGRVVTNLDEGKCFAPDAYFIPKTEFKPL